MPLLLVIAGLLAPRVVIFFLWMFTTWFTGVFETRAWPLLGFLILPLTTLWYSAVQNWYGGDWNWWTVLLLVLAVCGDLHSDKSSRRKR